MLATPLPASMDCPSCAAVIDFDRRFTPWCERCDWNVDAGSPAEPKPSWFDRRRQALARRLATASIDEVAGREAERPPRWSPAALIVLAISVAIIAAWFLLLAAGVAVVLSGNGIIVAILGGFLVVVAFISRPRLGSAEPHALTRTEAPETYRLLDDISTALGAPRIASIALYGDWNAGTYRFGLRQRTAIILGLPLWGALTDEERLAVLGHEVAHGVNGDTTRGAIEGTALRTLGAWAHLAEPDSLTSNDGGGLGLLSIPANVVLLSIAVVLTIIGEAITVLSFRPRLRAELYADRLAASIAGREAMVRGLERTALHGAHVRAVSAVAIGGRPAVEVFDELKQQIAITPPSELERLRRREARDPFRFDQSHPPLAQRIAVLRQQAAEAPTSPVTISPERMRAIDAEFAPAESRIARDLVEEHLASLS